MKLQTAMLARYAETEQGGLLNITGDGVDVFGIPELPLEFTMALALQLTFDESEADREHELAVIVLGPDLEPVGQAMTVPFTPGLVSTGPRGGGASSRSRAASGFSLRRSGRTSADPVRRRIGGRRSVSRRAGVVRERSVAALAGRAGGCRVVQGAVPEVRPRPAS